jgi:hypothetical protein
MNSTAAPPNSDQPRASSNPGYRHQDGVPAIALVGGQVDLEELHTFVQIGEYEARPCRARRHRVREGQRPQSFD